MGVRALFRSRRANPVARERAAADGPRSLVLPVLRPPRPKASVGAEPWSPYLSNVGRRRDSVQPADTALEGEDVSPPRQRQPYATAAATGPQKGRERWRRAAATSQERGHHHCGASWRAVAAGGNHGGAGRKIDAVGSTAGHKVASAQLALVVAAESVDVAVGGAAQPAAALACSRACGVPMSSHSPSRMWLRTK